MFKYIANHIGRHFSENKTKHYFVIHTGYQISSRHCQTARVTDLTKSNYNRSNTALDERITVPIQLQQRTVTTTFDLLTPIFQPSTDWFAVGHWSVQHCSSSSAIVVVLCVACASYEARQGALRLRIGDDFVVDQRGSYPPILWPWGWDHTATTFAQWFACKTPLRHFFPFSEFV